MNIAYIYGMDAAFMKYFSLAENNIQKKQNFSVPFITVFFTSIIFSLFFVLFYKDVGSVINLQKEFSYLIIYLATVLAIDTLSLLPFALLRMQNRPIKFAVIKFINIVVNLALNFILILKYDFGIEAIFISNLAASSLTFVLLLPDIFSNLTIKFSQEILIRMVKFGLPYMPGSLAAMMVQMISVPILRELTDDSTLGIFRANYKLGIFMMLFASMFQYAWQPFFLNNAKEENAKEIFSKVLTLFVLTGSSFWVILSLFIDDIASFEFLNGVSIIGKDFLGGIHIVPIILFSHLLYGMYINFQAGIYIEEKTKYFPLITGIGAITNISLNFILIPIYGIYGAALTSLISYFVMALGLFITAQKFYPIKYEYGKIAKILVTCLTIGTIYYALLFNGSLLMIYKLLLLLGFVSSLFVFNVIKISEIKNLFVLLKK
jgi:O-antigen/teichoic acid export membrane protein